MGLGQISWPPHQFAVKWAFIREALFAWFWFWKFFFEVLSFLIGLSHRCQIGLKSKKIISRELFLKMFILLQFDVVAKIFDSNPWNFYIKNRSSSAFCIFFQNFFCIFRSRMASFSYIYFGMKRHVFRFILNLSRVVKLQNY